MPEIEYNNLLYQISKKLDELDVGEQLLFLCRGKVTARSEENIKARSLFEELEQKGFLSPDHLVLLKGMLKGVNEWALFDEVEKFETKRKEYNNLVEKIVRVLDELNELKRLVSICGGKITEESQGKVQDVRSLFKELENNDWLGIDCLDILKEILTQTEKSDLLKEVEEFEQRRSRENKFRKRKAQATSFVSSVGEKLAGVLNIKTVFKAVNVGFKIASSLALLLRDSTYDQLAAAVNEVLPAGANLIQISEGCVSLKVQVVNLSALETLWRLYQDGTLGARLQALFVSDEMRELAGGEQVEAIVTIEPQEYEEARNKLAAFEAQEEPDENSKEGKRPKYLDEEKFSYIQNYLGKSETHSVTTETSDGGLRRSDVTLSELGIDEISDSPSKLCLKDLSKRVIADLSSRLQSDPAALDRFYRSFGLDAKKFVPKPGRWSIAKKFPDTPVKMLKEAFKALKLYDLVELLEKATKPRLLQPAFSIKEMENLQDTRDRPPKFYGKAEALIIQDGEDVAVVNNSEKIGTFFKALNPETQVSTLRMESHKGLLGKLKQVRESRKLTLSHGSTVYGKEIKEEIKEEFGAIMTHLKEEGEELTKINEKFVMAVSTALDKWVEHANDEGEEWTLYVVLINASMRDSNFALKMEKLLGEKLALINNTKLVITSHDSYIWTSNAMARETLQVYFSKERALATMVELLNKRWQTLDLTSVMQEVKRTHARRVKVVENLSCLPRLQKVDKSLGQVESKQE